MKKKKKVKSSGRKEGMRDERRVVEREKVKTG